MPSIGHVAVGLAAARLSAPPAEMSPGAWRASLVAASLLPDADVVAFALGIPYRAPFGHRGASHSLAFALLCGLAWSGLARGNTRGRMRAALVVAAVTASHGLLDTLTDGGLGSALFWPWSNDRFFAPWRPIPVAPIGLGMVSRWGLEVVLTELAMFLPLFAIGLWPRNRREAGSVEAGGGRPRP